MVFTSRTLATAHVLSILLLTATSASGQAIFQGIGDLPGGAYGSKAYGVSVDGSVVIGESSSAWGTQAVRWTVATGIVGLGDLPGGGYSSAGRGISDDGTAIVGWSSVASGTEAFRWTAAPGMEGLGELAGGAFFSQAQDASNDGSVVVGASSSAVPIPNRVEPFRWEQPGGMVGLGLPANTISGSASAVSGDGTVVVGTWDHSGFGVQAFMWTAAGGSVGLDDLTSLNDGFGVHSFGNAISRDGSIIVGMAIVADNMVEAFLWSGGVMVGLGDLAGGSHESSASGVSDDGSIVVGWGRIQPGAHEAMIWDAGNGMRSIRDILVNDHGLDLTGWHLEQATAVSGDGRTIVGFGVGPSGREGWVVRLSDLPVPGDCDGSGSADLADYTCLHLCLTSPLPSGLGSPCVAVDFDQDDDVDLVDIGRFFSLFTTVP